MQGWSAYAGEDIRAGQCVCQYAGELVSSAEAKIRLQKYDVREHTVGHALLVRKVLTMQSFSMPCFPRKT